MFDYDGIMKEVEENARKKEAQESAKSTYEIYSAYVDAGFTEEQALKIIISLITNMVSSKSEGE